MKKSELVSLIKECINEINIKKEKQSVAAQLGVMGGDGSVETVRIITGGDEIKDLLKSNYSNRIKLQTILDFGDIYKLGPTTDASEFAARDKKMKFVDAKLKGSLKSFAAVAKANKVKDVYVYDLAKKKWLHSSLETLPKFTEI